MASEAQEQLEFHAFLLARRTGRDWHRTHWAGLDTLYGYGLAIRHMAQMLGVSITELRRWKQKTSGWFTDVMQVAQLLALLDFLEHYGWEKPAAWLEMPLLNGSGVLFLDLYPHDLGMLLGLATGRVSVEVALDKYAPGWRTRPPSQWEVFTADDGYESVGLRADAAGT